MPSDPLDADVLARELVRPDSLWRSVDVVAETGSTNADLAGRARAGAGPGAVLLADVQTAGRGRRDRVWTAPPGTGIALSALVRPDVALARWTWLPLLTGLAVSDAIRQRAELSADLKWPNDVLVAGRKLGGILIERVEAPDGPLCVVGIGINVTLTRDQLPVPTATSLALELAAAGAGGRPLVRTTLVTTVLVGLERLLRHWAAAVDDHGLAGSYRERCRTIGREVRVRLADDAVVEGTAEGIDDNGRLVVATAAGRRIFSAGDVVHLR